MTEASTDKTLLRQDARNRALRTALQQLGFDVAASVILLLMPIVTEAQSFADFDWEVLLFLLTKTVIVTIFSFVMRLYVDASKIPTPLPPAPQSAPADVGGNEGGGTYDQPTLPFDVNEREK